MQSSPVFTDEHGSPRSPLSPWDKRAAVDATPQYFRHSSNTTPMGRATTSAVAELGCDFAKILSWLSEKLDDDFYSYIPRGDSFVEATNFVQFVFLELYDGQLLCRLANVITPQDLAPLAIAADDNDSAGARRTNFATFLGRCEELGLPPPFSLAEAVAFEDPQIFGGAIMALRKLAAVPDVPNAEESAKPEEAAPSLASSFSEAGEVAEAAEEAAEVAAIPAEMAKVVAVPAALESKDVVGKDEQADEARISAALVDIEALHQVHHQQLIPA